VALRPLEGDDELAVWRPFVVARMVRSHSLIPRSRNLCIPANYPQKSLGDNPLYQPNSAPFLIPQKRIQAAQHRSRFPFSLVSEPD